MIAILTESFGGKWYEIFTWYFKKNTRLSFFRPFWLSPRQAIVIPLHNSLDGYAQKVAAMLGEFYVDVEDSNKTYKKNENMYENKINDKKCSTLMWW